MTSWRGTPRSSCLIRFTETAEEVSLLGVRQQNAAAVRWLCLVESVDHGGDRADQHQHRGSHRIPGPVSEPALLLPGVLQTGVDLIPQNRFARAVLSSCVVLERKNGYDYGFSAVSYPINPNFPYITVN